MNQNIAVKWCVEILRDTVDSSSGNSFWKMEEMAKVGIIPLNTGEGISVQREHSRQPHVDQVDSVLGE